MSTRPASSFLVVSAIVAALCMLVCSAAASAETTGPQWRILSVDTPTNFKPGDESGVDAIVVTATNVGAASTDGSAIAIDDLLPAGLRAVAVFGDNAYHNPVGRLIAGENEGPPYGLSCTLSPTTPSCTTSERVDPGDTLIVTIQVDVQADAEGSSEVNSASVTGGGTASAAASAPVTISSAPTEYGVAKGGVMAATSTSQAGAHPNVTTEFFLNTINPRGETHAQEGNTSLQRLLASEPADPPKDVGFDLPAGLVGTTVGMPRCTMADVVDSAECPQDTMVGAATLIVYSANAGRVLFTVPVYNIAPAPGEPAAFAFNGLFFPVRLDTSVLSDGEYNVRVTAPNLTQGGADYMSSVTIWGVPAEHNAPGPDAGARTLGGSIFLGGGGPPGVTFGGTGVEEHSQGGGAVEKTVLEQRVPLLTNPSQCSTPLEGLLETDSWEGPGPGVFATERAPLGTATGCGQLSFKSSVSMLPDTLEAGAPAGYSFDLRVPQDTDAEALAAPDVKRTTVTLPLGTVISPSSANGLGDCTDEQFELHSGAPGGCPRDSQVGTVRIKTPALEERLNGEVYLAAPECDPCTPRNAADGTMIRLFVQVVGEGEDGVVVKLEGSGRINQQTGQLTTTFENTPQLPFSDFQLTLQGGERATLANPRTCGEATTTTDLTPWSTPYTPDATPTSSFEITGPGGGPCLAPQFSPSFAASTTSDRAGEFAPFTLSFGRSDADEFLNGIQVKLPPGLLGMLSKVSLCGEAQANTGTCGPESQIGEVNVETGPGTDPFVVTGGRVYITGPYRGAPYGLSIVVPAKAGPYTLSGTTGNGTVVVRSAISVNPETSALTVTSDPLPTELDGIPLQLRAVGVTINRPEFTFNPTTCSQQAIAGTLTSAEGGSAVVSSSVTETNCARLGFQPKFAVSTSGKTSKANGASLDAKVSYPAAPQGAEADIAKVKVDLPKQLPSRLTTLQKACTAAVFDANPANCPAASVIGTVKVNTPVLPVALTGPVYFVSHGGEAFPSLTMVLQGDGVRVDLVGATFISKAGITSTTFNTVPDVPFSSFELYLPEGKYSALAAYGDLCTSKLAMPTAFVGQNGAEIHESTKIGVTGCPRVKQATMKKKAKTKAKKSSSARNSSIDRGDKS